MESWFLHAHMYIIVRRAGAFKLQKQEKMLEDYNPLWTLKWEKGLLWSTCSLDQVVHATCENDFRVLGGKFGSLVPRAVLLIPWICWRLLPDSYKMQSCLTPVEGNLNQRQIEHFASYPSNGNLARHFSLLNPWAKLLCTRCDYSPTGMSWRWQAFLLGKQWPLIHYRKNTPWHQRVV